MKPIPEIQQLSSLPKQLGWLVHIIIWFVLILFPFLFKGRDSGSITLTDYLRFFIMMIGTLTVFYVNYIYLVKRFLFTRQLWLYLLSNILLYTILIIITHILLELIPPPAIVAPRSEHRGSAYWFILFDTIKFIFLTALSVALKVTGSWYEMDAERKELEKNRSEAELQNLKNQLNPHFLFNTLNNIYSLIAVSSERAQDAIHELSRLLRYMLYDSSQPLVTLEKDMDFIRNYVELMRIRLPKQVELQTDMQMENPDTLIAPLLFISLIENAFKHGVSNSKPSFIDLKMAADKKHIHCITRNSYFPKDKQDKSGSGIGLMNLKKRLDLLYPGNYVLICKQIDDMYCCELKLNLSKET